MWNGGEGVEVHPWVMMKSTLTWISDDIFGKRKYYNNHKNIFSKSGHDNQGLTPLKSNMWPLRTLTKLITSVNSLVCLRQTVKALVQCQISRQSIILWKHHYHTLQKWQIVWLQIKITSPKWQSTIKSVMAAKVEV